MDIPYFLMSDEKKKEVKTRKMLTGILLFGTAIGIAIGLFVRHKIEDYRSD